MNPLTRAAVAAAAALSLLSLSACGGESKPSDSPTAQPSSSTAPTSAAPSTASPSATPTGPRTPAQPATSLDAIQVTGGKKEAPTVTFTAPFGIDQTRSKVLAEGDGPVVKDTATVEVLYWGVNGATMQKFDENYTSGKTTSFPLDQVVPGFKKGLSGQKVGSRVLIGMPGADGYDASGGSPQADIQVGDTLLFVVDIVGASLSEPVGEKQAQDPAGPQVSDDLANPTITIPAGWKAPTDTVSKVVIKGAGTAVKATDTVLVNYRGVSAKTGQVVEESYGKAPEQAPLAMLVKGWQKGLEGKTVGSRVLIVMPPADAYGSQGNASAPAVPADDTLIYVVDILYVANQ